MGVVREFKEFAVKGNAVEMAIGIILGVAFNKVVHSIVNDILMPPIGMLIGGVEFKDLELVLRAAKPAADGTTLPAVALRYGALVNAIMEFLIVALSVLFVIKLLNRLNRLMRTSGA